MTVVEDHTKFPFYEEFARRHTIGVVRHIEWVFLMLLFLGGSVFVAESISVRLV